jgi:hypothetical protein
MAQHLDRRSRRWERDGVGDEGERTERGGETESIVFRCTTQHAYYPGMRGHGVNLGCWFCSQDVQTGTGGSYALVFSTDNVVLCKFSLGCNTVRMEYQLLVDLESGSYLPFHWLDPSYLTPAQVHPSTSPASAGLEAPSPTMPFEAGDAGDLVHYTRLVLSCFESVFDERLHGAEQTSVTLEAQKLQLVMMRRDALVIKAASTR